jgi:hypothetical protein
MAQRRGRAANPQEHQITDQEIHKQEHLFAPEASAPLVDTTTRVQWPKYVRLQRQRRVLATRLWILPPVNQFNYTADTTLAL